MKRISLFLVITCLSLLMVKAHRTQIPIRTDSEGGAYNVAVINKLFINVFGYKEVETWLSLKRKAGFIWEVDSHGRIKSFKSQNSIKPLLSNVQEQKLLSYIKTHSVYLCFWYFDPCLGEHDLLRIKKDAEYEIRGKAKSGRKITIRVPFNDELVWDYEEVRNECLKKGVNLSYIQYIRYKIHKYIHDE